MRYKFIIFIMKKRVLLPKDMKGMCGLFFRVDMQYDLFIFLFFFYLFSQNWKSVISVFVYLLQNALSPFLEHIIIVLNKI